MVVVLSPQGMRAGRVTNMSDFIDSLFFPNARQLTRPPRECAPLRFCQFTYRSALALRSLVTPATLDSLPPTKKAQNRHTMRSGIHQSGSEDAAYASLSSSLSSSPCQLNTACHDSLAALRKDMEGTSTASDVRIVALRHVCVCVCCPRTNTYTAECACLYMVHSHKIEQLKKDSIRRVCVYQ